MDIPPISPFDPSDWNHIHLAFHQAPIFQLGQAWLDSPSPHFRPGQVQYGWNQDAFLVLASFTDDCLFTQMTADNQNAWDLGDVFELFLKHPSRQDYFEFHVTPNAHRLQLHFPHASAINQIRDKLASYKTFLVEKLLFDFAVRSVPLGWEIFLSVPAVSLVPKTSFHPGSQLLTSCSRYDYDDKGSPPVTSSTSTHKIAGFHRQEEWSLLTFSA